MNCNIVACDDTQVKKCDNCVYLLCDNHNLNGHCIQISDLQKDPNDWWANSMSLSEQIAFDYNHCPNKRKIVAY